uniref:Peptidase metallopeptidase domain-containing protein n=1 Tax=Electrophorus electricus TaxID=8005 RepID=A0A4W4FWZ6_ELEEL
YLFHLSSMMIGVALFTFAVLTDARSAPIPNPYAHGVDWLIRYGYLPPSDSPLGRLHTKEAVERAICEMQSFAGIKETGRLDGATLTLMSVPRCSLPDILGSEFHLKNGRKRRETREMRYNLSGLNWNKTHITWRFPSASVSPDLQPALVELILTHALRVWSDTTPLLFSLLRPSTYALPKNADIKVSFTSRYHDDGYPFDGKGGTLAHAFFPELGDTHFDDEENWSYGADSSSVDLFTVAMHEFGHALGLAHSSSKHSIMKPYYQGAVGDIPTYTLPVEDRLGIQALYGLRRDLNPPSFVAPPTPSLPQLPNPAVLDRCRGGYDAIANIRGEIFFFRRQYFWRMHHSGSLSSFAAALIHSFWIGLPPETDRIDAVYERNDGHIVFFIGNQYWVFKDTTSLPGYPQPLTKWGLWNSAGEVLGRVDAVFVWPHNGRTYVFSGREYWRFDEAKTHWQPEAGYPKPTSIWGVPSDPDDVIGMQDGNTYFFKGMNYWTLKKGRLEEDTLSPNSIAADWLQCDDFLAPTYRPTMPQYREEECGFNTSTAALVQVSLWSIISSIYITFVHVIAIV